MQLIFPTRLYVPSGSCSEVKGLVQLGQSGAAPAPASMISPSVNWVNGRVIQCRCVDRVVDPGDAVHHFQQMEW